MIKNMEQKDKALRDSVKVGDEVIIVLDGQGHHALVLAVNDNLIGVQTEDDGQQLWVKRSKLYAVP